MWGPSHRGADNRATRHARVLLISCALALLTSAPQVSLADVASRSGQLGRFADPAFQRIWERSDLPVANGRVARSWAWGNPLGGAVQERYREAPNDVRTVQYFDKARMEINNPAGNPKDPYYVTNGRLVAEMVSGQLQFGRNDLMYVGTSVACVAGECLDSPGYESGAPLYLDLLLVSSLAPNEDWSECRTARFEICHSAQIATGTVMPTLYLMVHSKIYDGADNTYRVPEGFVPSGQAPVEIRAAAYVKETQHNIPDVFWQYMNAEGTVYEGGAYRSGKVIDWVSAFGYPITEPFWIVINVGGKRKLVLFQAFERRTLTYSPTNPEGWRVEMGNVGAQYLRWRNGAALYCGPRGVRMSGGLIDFWHTHGDVRQSLGCPSREIPWYSTAPYLKNIDLKVATAYQPFERGSMFYVERTVYRNHKELHEKAIYALFNDGSFMQFADTWTEGEPASSGAQPPAGLLEPVRGFGKAWREGAGGALRERLGWATATEQGGEGRMVRFGYGELLWSPVPNKIIVFYGPEEDGAFPATDKDPDGWTLRYKVFDDPYKER